MRKVLGNTFLNINDINSKVINSKVDFDFFFNGLRLSCQVGGWTRQPLESPIPEESTKKPVITAVVVIAAGGAGGPLS